MVTTPDAVLTTMEGATHDVTANLFAQMIDFFSPFHHLLPSSHQSLLVI
jgi:hypothetical protein